MKGTTEIWLELPEFHGRYSVSNFGYVRNNKTGKIKKNKIDSSGYASVGLYLNKQNEDMPFRVHRLVAQLFIQNLEGKPEINHKDWNRLNPHVDNLEWVTRKENLLHRDKNNTPKKFNNNEKKPVKAIMPDGEIREFESRWAASISLKIKDSKIFDALRNGHRCFGIKFIENSALAEIGA